MLPFEQGLLDYIDHNTDILKTIRETEDFTADTEAALDKAVDEFRSTFVSSNGKPLVEKKPDVAKQRRSIRKRSWRERSKPWARNSH